MASSIAPDVGESAPGAEAGAPPPVRLGPAERAALGRAARRTSPRASLADWEPPGDRADPVDVLEAQSASRIPELVPVRYGRMLASPFAFYRGGAAIMAADLSRAPTSGLAVQACGDAHLSNFGIFASPERSLVFDINDFDETLPGPWEWDVKRLAVSFAVAGRHNGFPAAQRRRVLLTVAATYRQAMAEFAGLPQLDVWYSSIRVQPGMPRLREMLDKKQVAEAGKVVAKARSRDSADAVARLTQVVDGRRRIVSQPPLVVPVEELLPGDQAAEFDAWMHRLINAYRDTLLSDRRHLLDQYRYTHLARKVVGVGSVGTRAWIVLMTGRDAADDLLLQAKEAQASVLEPYAGQSAYPQHGQRVVEGQRLMQASSDIFLGWMSTTGPDGARHDYYFRQLRDWKGSWDPTTMDSAMMGAYATMCGWTLARAHARSGDRVALAAYLGSSDKVDRAIADFAETYADQNERDFAALAAAVRAGRVTARTGL